VHCAPEVRVIDATLTVIGDSRRSSTRWREVWEYRELLYFLVWRDVKVRYKQTLLGVAWALVQPLATMVVFSVVFGRLAAMPSDGVPYPLFSLAALVPWTYFSTAITQGAASISYRRCISRDYWCLWRRSSRRWWMAASRLGFSPR
jgi:hypothetical protein